MYYFIIIIINVTITNIMITYATRSPSSNITKVNYSPTPSPSSNITKVNYPPTYYSCSICNPKLKLENRSSNK